MRVSLKRQWTAIPGDKSDTAASRADPFRCSAAYCPHLHECWTRGQVLISCTRPELFFNKKKIILKLIKPVNVNYADQDIGRRETRERVDRPADFVTEIRQRWGSPKWRNVAVMERCRYKCWAGFSHFETWALDSR